MRFAFIPFPLPKELFGSGPEQSRARIFGAATSTRFAKNCRTSVEMIEKFYASLIKDMLDASAINVRKDKAPKARVPKTQRGAAEGESSVTIDSRWREPLYAL